MNAHLQVVVTRGWLWARRRVWKIVETHQRVIVTRWWCWRQDECPSASRRDSWVVMGPASCVGES